MRDFVKNAMHLCIALVITTLATIAVSSNLCASAAVANIDESTLSESHELLDWKPTAGSYWNSPLNASLYTDNTPFCNQYIGSGVRFSKSQIPIGSVIYIDTGYHYRPEGWQNASGANSGTRPGNVSTRCILVDEAWWGNYTYRAFQIQNNDSSKRYTADGASYSWDLRKNFDEAKNALRIYVPKSRYIELNFKLGYWDSTSSPRLATGSELAKQFVATQMFTRETLPIGSVIEIDSGYKYRPDGWITLDTKNSASTRPQNVTATSVTVTEEWWGSFTYRGFNISKIAQSDISDSYPDVASHFRIYAPNSYIPPEAEEEIEVVIPKDDNVIRILAIGNSYSNDAMHYTHKISEGLGIKAEFYSLYYPGCTVSQHHSFYNDNVANYDLYRNSSKYLNDKVTMRAVLEATDFDYVTFQQGSWSSDSYSSYSLLDDLMAIVRKYQPNAEFMIHQTWGYCEARACNGNAESSGGKGYATSADMFKAVEECYSKAAKDNGDLRLIKSGRAVETAKTEYDYTDDYGKTNSIYDDFNSHLTSRGDYLAGCVWIETIFGVDVRNTTFTNSFDDADTLQEIAHKTVGNAYYASVTVGEGSDFGGTPVIKTANVDGFDYDGRARILVQSGTEVVKTVYQNVDGSMPEIELPEGTYTFKIESNGYLSHTTEALTVKVGEDYSIPEFTLIAGDIKDAGFCGDGVVDIDDFTRVLRSFAGDSTQEMRVICDLDCNGTVNVSDLAIVKGSFGKRS